MRCISKMRTRSSGGDVTLRIRTGKGPGLRGRLRRLVQQNLTTLRVETKKQRALPGEESHVTGAVVERDGPNPLSAQAVVELLGQRSCQE